MVVTFGFYGSSSLSIAKKHESIIENFLKQIFNQFQEVRIITGGYSGFMELVCEKAKEISNNNSNIYLETYGILYSGFSDTEDGVVIVNPNAEKPNKFLDKTINTTSIGERIDTIIELSDFIFALPGSNGTLNEILHTSEVIKYPPFNIPKITYNNFFVSDYWLEKVSNESIVFFNDKSEFKFSIDSLKKFSYEEEEEELQNQIKKIICFDNKNINDIISLDYAYIFYNEKHGINRGNNESNSIHGYTKVLASFLEEYGSLLGFSKNHKGFSNLGNLAQKQKDLKLIKNHTSIQKKRTSRLSTLSSEEVFKLWNDHLIENDFGNQSFWVNRVLKIKGFEVNISCFLVLDTVLPKHKCNYILNAINNHISYEGVISLLKEMDQYLVTTSELESFQKNIRANEHTIIDLFSNVHDKIINNDLIDDYTQNNFEFLQLCLDVTFGRENESFEENLQNKPIKVFIDYLRIKQGHHNFTSDIKIHGSEKNAIKILQKPRSFLLLLWNFWSNAYKYSEVTNRIVKIDISYLEDYNQITISNKIHRFSRKSSNQISKMNSFLNFLKGETETIDKNGGMVISRSLLDNLKYCHLVSEKTKINIKDGTFNVTLQINKHE